MTFIHHLLLTEDDPIRHVDLDRQDKKTVDICYFHCLFFPLISEFV